MASTEEPDEGEENDDDDALISVDQRQQIRYSGVRGDYSLLLGKENTPMAGHRLGAGLELRRARGNLDFSLVSPPAEGFDPLSDNRALRGSDLGFYVQDDWTRRHVNLNYGRRASLGGQWDLFVTLAAPQSEL